MSRASKIWHRDLVQEVDPAQKGIKFGIAVLIKRR